jgi:hypothetical protein
MKTKYLLGIIAIALLGIWGSKLLNFSLFSPNVIRAARFDMKGFEIKPYQRADLDNDREARAFLAKSKAYRVAGAGTYKPSALPAQPTLVKLDAPKKAVATDPKKAAADKKKKAALAKKKAKRNARGGLLNSYTTESDVAKSSPENNATRNEASESYNSGSFANAGASAAAQAEQKDAKDLAFWKSALLNSPSKENTTEFIRAFQKNEISEEIFYTLVQLMYEEGTAEYQSLAVIAAGSVSNIKSFDFFIAVLSDQRQGTPVAANAEGQLNEYSSLNSIFIVRQVLNDRAEDEQKIFYAAQAIDNSTETYLSTAANENGSASPNTISSSQRQLFAGFVPALENILSLYANNAQIVEPGKRALDRIKALTPVVAQNQVTP